MEHLPSPEIYSIILSGDILKLWDHPRHKLTPFLSYLCRAVFGSAKNEPTTIRDNHRKGLYSLLLNMEDVNKIKKYMALDFVELKNDGLKERELMKKRLAVSDPDESKELNVAIEFEKSSEKGRFRLVLKELLRIMCKADSPFQVEESNLFSCKVFLTDVSHIICIAVIELSSILSLTQVAESLLRVKNGSYLMTCIVANLPHCYNEVVTSLIMKGESLDEVSLSGRLRSSMIRDLIHLNPIQSTYLQWLALSNQKLPTLTIFIALDHDEGRLMGGAGIISLMSDIVIHGDKSIRQWFGQYIKLMQHKYRKHKVSAVTSLRKYLMKRLIHFMDHSSAEDETPRMEIGEGVETVGGAEGEGLEEEMVVEGMDTTTLELVDQMEIEIEEGDKKMAEDDIGQKPSRHRFSSSFSVEQVVFPQILLANQFSDEMIVELTQLLHVCCGLKIQVHLYLTNEESSALLNLITCTCPPFSSAGVRFIQVGLCLLLSCPFLINSTEGESAVVRWLNWILSNLPQFESVLSPVGGSGYGEMLLLIIIHLQEKQTKQIEKLVSSVLEMKLTTPLASSNHFLSLKDLFLQVFKENVVCSHAVSVPPTPSLSGHMTGYLPIHCIHQLMRSKAFRKHGVLVNQWIYNQIMSTAEPLHPSLPPLIEEFVMALLVNPIPPAKSNHSAVLQVPFTADEVLNVFIQSEDTPTDHTHSISSQMLMLYYILYYQDTYLIHLKTLLATSNRGTIKCYGPNVLLHLPIKRLLHHASIHQESYQTLYSSLLRLVVTHFPHLSLPDDWMKEQSLHQGAGLRPLVMLSSKKVTIEMATTILYDLHSKPSKAFLVLSYLDSLSPSYLVPFSSLITSTLPLLLDASAGKRLKLLYSSLWMKLNSIIPRRLWVESINSLRPCDLKTHPLYTHHNLVEDPIIILRCDQRIFRCPMLLEITLKILAGYVSASRVWLSEKAHALNCMTSATPESGLHLSNQERDELRIALTAAQESSIIQLLLEICLPTSEDRKESSLLGPQLTNLREIQCLICSYLHQVFISEPSMVKLVHFQGYPLQLLPLMVTGIPSIHIVVDFLMELLSQTQLEKQVFAIQLTAHVTHQYPIPESLSILKDIFKKVHSFIEDIPTKSYHSFFVPILPALVKFCQSFPPLTTEVVEILVHICQVCSVVDDLSRGQVLPVDAVSIMKMFSMNGGATACHDMNKSTDPVLAMEDELEYLKKSNLIDCVKWTFKEIMSTVLLKVSGKT